MMANKLFFLLFIVLHTACGDNIVSKDLIKTSSSVFTQGDTMFCVIHNELQDDYRIMMFAADSSLLAECNYMGVPTPPVIDSITKGKIYLSFEKRPVGKGEHFIRREDDLTNEKESYPDYFIYLGSYSIIYVQSAPVYH